MLILVKDLPADPLVSPPLCPHPLIYLHLQLPGLLPLCSWVPLPQSLVPPAAATVSPAGNLLELQMLGFAQNWEGQGFRCSWNLRTGLDKVKV